MFRLEPLWNFVMISGIFLGAPGLAATSTDAVLRHGAGPAVGDSLPGRQGREELFVRYVGLYSSIGFCTCAHFML